MSDNRPNQSYAESKPGFEERLRTAAADIARGDHALALKKFIALIDDGCDQANGFVGALYEGSSEAKGVERDYEKARFYYERAIETRGDVESYLGLARIYYRGLGVRPDFSKAFQYCDLVATEAEGSGTAYLMLGQMYQRGEGVKKDIEKAREYYDKAINEGYVMGYTYLGLLENEQGNFLKGWRLRFKAFLLFCKLVRKDRHHPLLRGS